MRISEPGPRRGRRGSAAVATDDDLLGRLIDFDLGLAGAPKIGEGEDALDLLLDLRPAWHGWGAQDLGTRLNTWSPTHKSPASDDEGTARDLREDSGLQVVESFVDRSRRRSGPTGQPGAEIALATGRFRHAEDPALSGVNGGIRSRLGAGQSAQQIVAYLNEIQPGLGAEMRDAISKAVTFRRTHPEVPMGEYTIDVDNMLVAMSPIESAINKVAQSPAGAYAIGAGDMVTGGFLDELTDDSERTRAVMELNAKRNPYPDLAGRVAGGLMMSGVASTGTGAVGAGRAAPVIGDALYGAAYGAGSEEDDRLSGALIGGLTAGGASGALRNFGHEVRGAIADERLTRPIVRQQRLFDKYVDQGFAPDVAEYLAQPYEGMGHHFIPRNRKIGPFNRYLKLPPSIGESRFNVLRPRGMSRGDFYERHYRVDPSFHGARLPKGLSVSGWSGKRLGLQKHGPVGRVLMGSPRSAKVATGSILAPTSFGGYLLFKDDEGEVDLPNTK